MILFLEGQASQREVIMGAREALPRDIKIYASHHQDRPEITSQADVALREPHNPQERIDWALTVATVNNIKVVHAGRKADLYEARREDFERNEIELVTGATGLDTFRIEDKSVFVEECQESGLLCVPGITVTNPDELAKAHAEISCSSSTCVKPVTGIYGQGFWRLIDTLDPFAAMANPDDRRINTDMFISMYSQTPNPSPLLVMPYMSGDECSIDVVCEQGEPVSWVCRRKTGLYQVFERDGVAVELALSAVRQFKCDGIVNVQTMDDADGVPHLLEINLRYSGGLSYTPHSGINLPGIFAARRLGLPAPVDNWKNNSRIKPTTAAIPLS